MCTLRTEEWYSITDKEYSFGLQKNQKKKQLMHLESNKLVQNSVGYDNFREVLEHLH